MDDWTNILSEAVKGYASIEAAKASADGSAGYGGYGGYRVETIADQRGAPGMTGYTNYTGAVGGVPTSLLVIGGFAVLAAVFLIASK